jgi:peptidoglycan biosynthesis protein MviN/MurJ (putative lipid II flippase)
MWVSLASILVHAPTSFGMMMFLSTVGVTPERPNGFGHVGVALATSTVALVNFFALTLLMRRRINRLNGREIGASFAKIAIASAVMSAVAYSTYQFLLAYLDETLLWVRFVEAFVPIGLAAITFVIGAKLLRITEIEKLYTALRRKFAR